MRQNILNILRESGRPKLSSEDIANQLHATVPAVVTELLALRALGNIKSWGSGLPTMLYWSM